MSGGAEASPRGRSDRCSGDSLGDTWHGVRGILPLWASRVSVLCLVASLVACLVASSAASAVAADRIRIAAQKTGTLAWELDIIRTYGLDKQAGLDIQVVELASTEAGRIALASGSADMIVSDWLWVARERSLGTKLVYYPYSSTLGAVMITRRAELEKIGGFAGLADVAQTILRRLVGVLPWCPWLLAPIGFFAIAWVTGRYFRGAEGSGIPQTVCDF